MAKDQGLSLNPAKISGICDRLMCCLRFEHETYQELAKKLPKPGQLVNTRKGPGEVKTVILMHERLQVRYPDGTVEDLKAAEVWGLEEEIPPLPPAREGEEAELPKEDNTMPLMVRQRPKSAQRERPASTRPERRERPTRPEPTKPAPAPTTTAPAEARAEGEEATGAKRRRRRRPDRRRQPGEGQEPAAPAQNAAQPPRPAPERKPAAPQQPGGARPEGGQAQWRQDVDGPKGNSGEEGQPHPARYPEVAQGTRGAAKALGLTT